MRFSRPTPLLPRALAAVLLLASAAPAVRADETSAAGGYLRPDPAREREAQAYPLPAIFSATIRKDWGAFAVKNVTTNETFEMPIYPHYPVKPGVKPMLLGEIENDGKTLILPVDLTGRGLSDLVMTREGWGGWRVFTNGQRLGQPFDGFVDGFVPKGSEEVASRTFNLDTRDIQVDDNLLTAVGDFLGNGTEQVAYFRPGWDAIVVAGAHGKSRVEADLKGIPADREAGRKHYLFAFKAAKPGERTRIAYHRHGEARMLVFAYDGSRFQRSDLPTAEHWNLLNQYQPNPL